MLNHHVMFALRLELNIRLETSIAHTTKDEVRGSLYVFYGGHRSALSAFLTSFMHECVCDQTSPVFHKNRTDSGPCCPACGSRFPPLVGDTTWNRSSRVGSVNMKASVNNALEPVLRQQLGAAY